MLRHAARTLAVACALVVASCREPTANADDPAYDPTYSAGGRDVLYHWRAGATIRVYALPTTLNVATDLPGALRTAFATWADVAEFREYHFALVDALTDADVVVRFRDDRPIVSYADCQYPTSLASGVTFFCPNAALTSVQTLPLITGGQGHVRMEIAVAPPSQTSHFQSIVTHELGHVLGIGAPRARARRRSTSPAPSSRRRPATRPVAWA